MSAKKLRQWIENKAKEVKDELERFAESWAGNDQLQPIRIPVNDADRRLRR